MATSHPEKQIPATTMPPLLLLHIELHRQSNVQIWALQRCTLEGERFQGCLVGECQAWMVYDIWCISPWINREVHQFEQAFLLDGHSPKIRWHHPSIGYHWWPWGEHDHWCACMKEPKGVIVGSGYQSNGFIWNAGCVRAPTHTCHSSSGWMIPLAGLREWHRGADSPVQGSPKPMLQALPDLPDFIPFKDHTIWFHQPPSVQPSKFRLRNTAAAALQEHNPNRIDGSAWCNNNFVDFKMVYRHVRPD